MNQDQGIYGQTVIDSANNQNQGRFGDNFSKENQRGIDRDKVNSDAWICPNCETVNYEAACEVCGFSKPSEGDNSHTHQRENSCKA